MNFEYLFSNEEVEHWSETINRLSKEPWWNDFVGAITEDKGLSEDKQQQIADALVNLLDDYIVMPLSSRLYPSTLISDMLVKYVLRATGKSIDEFHKVGNSVSDAILANETLLNIPKGIFELQNVDDIALWALSTSLTVNKMMAQQWGVIGSFVGNIIKLAGENEGFADVLHRHGIIDILDESDEDAYVVHFDRFLAALGDTNFLAEVTPYLTEGLPVEIFIGKNSTFAIAISASLVNSLLFSALLAKTLDKENEMMLSLSKLKEHLERIESLIKNYNVDWDNVMKHVEEAFDTINFLRSEVEEMEQTIIPQIIEKARTLGIYADIGMEAMLLAYGSDVDNEIWKWLAKTQEISLQIAANSDPLNRQPVYWLALCLARLSTTADNVDEKIRQTLETMQKRILSSSPS